MRAIVIRPKLRLILEEDIDPAKLSDLIGGSGYVERVPLPNNHWLWVDEEGLLQPNPTEFFRIPRVHSGTFAGTGVILGESRNGEDHADCLLNAELLPQEITFPRVRFIGFQDKQEMVNHPIFGEVMSFTRTAKFEDL